MFTLYFGEPSGRVPKTLRRHAGRAFLLGSAGAAAGIKRSAGARGLRGKGEFTWAGATSRKFPRGKADSALSPGSGSPLLYINTWAMQWPSDYPTGGSQ